MSLTAALTKGGLMPVQEEETGKYVRLTGLKHVQGFWPKSTYIRFFGQNGPNPPALAENNQNRGFQSKLAENKIFKPKSTKIRFFAQHGPKPTFRAKKQPTPVRSKSATARFSDQSEVFWPKWTKTKCSTWYPPILKVLNMGLP